MTVYEFNDPVNRSIGDNSPIVFQWPTAGATITAQRAFDNETFEDCAGAVTEITVASPQYKLSYAAADRPTTPSIITYKFTDGTDTAYLQVHISPEIPAAVSSLTPDADLSSLMTEIGPKRVKTKDMEVEAHDPMKIQQLLERRQTKQTYLSQFGFQIVRPKNGGRCGKCT